MKSFFLIFVIFIFSSCSFDNKTGIWKDASNIPEVVQDVRSIDGDTTESRYENIFTKNQLFNEEVDVLSNYFFEHDAPVQTNSWLEQYGFKTNNISNFSYSGNNILVSKSSKLNKLLSNKNIIFYKDNLINYDHKGKIFIYSLSQKKKIFEYNFYKKKFKKFKKIIYLAVDKDILYAADNLGYVYAINIKSESLIWAKNYGIPFRSNIKVIDGQILAANQDNKIYAINIITGDSIWQFSTSITFLKSDFINNFVVDEPNGNLIFLNTSGELYSINYVNQKINWILNFKKSALAEDTDLFLSQPVIVKNNSLIISTERAILNYNSINGNKNWNFPTNSTLKPILTTNYTYIFSKNNLLICLENKTGNVLWSKYIYKNLNAKIKVKKIGKFTDFKIVNNELNLFSANGYLLSFNYSNGNLKNAEKISKNGISSNAVFLKNNMFLIDNKNKLLKFN
jgi:outer membrane protein assembly factor BamB